MAVEVRRYSSATLPFTVTTNWKSTSLVLLGILGKGIKCIFPSTTKETEEKGLIFSHLSSQKSKDRFCSQVWFGPHRPVCSSAR